MDKTIDLHVHSEFSDGLKSVSEIITMARNNNVGYLSLTEHYNISSYNIAKKLAGEDIVIIPGLEVGTSLQGYNLSNKKHVLHLVVYFPTNRIYKILDDFEKNRNECVKKTLEKLRRARIYIPYSKLYDFSRDSLSIGRFDIAITMVRLGIVETTAEAYSKYLDKGRVGYVDRDKMSPTAAINMFANMGAVVGVAHPKSIKTGFNSEYKLLKKLKDAGLSCIEVYSSFADSYSVSKYLQIAKELDLIPTVGSDYHGRQNDEIMIGSGINNNLNCTDYTIIERLLKKRDELIK